MSTIIRPEVSEKNKYWIDKHRYYELKHFCLQYPIWKKIYTQLSSLSSTVVKEGTCTKTNRINDPTGNCAEDRLYYSNRIKMVEEAAKDADPELWNYIIIGVTEGIPYNILQLKTRIPCCKDVYYNLYRRFFWLLSKARK